MPKSWVHQSHNIDQIWALSSWNAAAFVRSGIPAKKIAVVPLGIDCNKFILSKRTLVEPKVVLFIGGALPRKGIDGLLNAWKYFERFDNTSILVIISRYKHSVDVNGLIQSVGLKKDRILYITKSLTPTEILSWYERAKVVVHPARVEGFGLTVLEAMAMGKHVIASPAGGTADFISHDFVDVLKVSLDVCTSYPCSGDSKSLCIFPNGCEALTGRAHWFSIDVFDLAEKLIRAVRIRHENQPKREAMRNFVCTHFSWKSSINILLSILLKQAKQNIQKVNISGMPFQNNCKFSVNELIKSIVKAEEGRN